MPKQPMFGGHKLPKVHLVRQIGDRKVAILDGGFKVYREENVFLPSQNKTVKCMPYDNHFVFRDPRPREGWLLMCSCGSPAVTIGMNQYKQYVSDKTEMLACYVYTNTGKHIDGST